MNKPYALIGFANAKPEMAAELGELMLSFASRSRVEEGCLEYHVHRVADNPNVLVFYEVWQSQEDLTRHGEKSYMKEFMTNRMRYLERDIDVHFLTVED